MIKLRPVSALATLVLGMALGLGVGVHASTARESLEVSGSGANMRAGDRLGRSLFRQAPSTRATKRTPVLRSRMRRAPVVRPPDRPLTRAAERKYVESIDPGAWLARYGDVSTTRNP